MTEPEELPQTGAWLAPAARLWLHTEELVRYGLLLVAAAGALLYVGAVLERRQLRGHLRVLDGAAAGGTIDLTETATEAADGDRG